MRKLFSAITLFVITSISVLTAQNLDEVLKNHFEAVGQTKLKKVESVVTTGSLNQMGMEIPFKQISMRPNLLRIEGTFQGLSFVQTYNGVDGWTLNPFAGTTEAEPIPADQLKELKLQADMDGMMWNWKEKGYTVTLDSTEDVEGTTCYKVKVSTPEGGTYTNFIDNESYMVIKTKAKIMVMGAEVESESFFSNYMQVDGIAFPGKIENRYNGVTGETIVVQKVEMNVELEKSIFEKPTSN